MTRKTIIWLSIAFVVLNIFDLITTWVALDAGLQEGNVLIKYLVENHFILFSVMKLCVVGVIIYAYNKYFTEHMEIKSMQIKYIVLKIKSIALVCLNVGYSGIVLNNLVWWLT